MALQLKQSLKLSQQLVMTPQLQQAIKLLQLNRMELAQHCQNELLENPILEELEGSGDKTEPKMRETQPEVRTQDDEVNPNSQQGMDDVNLENLLNNHSQRKEETRYRVRGNDDLPSYEATLTSVTTLAEHLLDQAQLTKLSDTEMRFVQAIIGNLDENGYLATTLEDMALARDVSVRVLEHALSKVQELDPAGVGARDLRECLLIQTRHLDENDLLRVMIRDYLPLLEKRKYDEVAKTLKISVQEILQTVERMKKLDPKPGRQFFDESSQYITPDIYVRMINGEPVISQNEDGLPKLRLSSYYQSLLTNTKSTDEEKEYIHDKMRSALWLIRSIHQRQRTIYKVTQSIIQIQRDFFDEGVKALKPMVLKDVAQDIGMHESTVSRVTTNKYVHTPQGIFELKFFFNSGIKSVTGSDMASEAVKQRIKAIIDKEDPRKPYSDQEIVEILRQSDVDIARRTVAKYREMLGLLSSSKRKNIYH
jgi:RNA polymerase sigma-54 factor